MFLRLILILGVGLILLSGGAMAWQYWQGLPLTRAAAETPADPGAGAAAGPAQTWLISPGGGLVDRDLVRQVLRQDRLVEGREVRIALRAPLTDLLAEGEQLPEEAYREVFADIRAALLSKGFCDQITGALARTCQPDRSRVVEGSYDAATGTAEFALTLAYAEPVDAPLPDLTNHALFQGFGGLDAPAATTPEALLAEAAAVAKADCAVQAPDAAACRVVGITLNWNGTGTARWHLAWFAPLPEGMYPAPPLF